MFIDINKDKIHEIQMSWYSWRNNASTTTMVLLSFLVACFTGLMAQSINCNSMESCFNYFPNICCITCRCILR